MRRPRRTASRMSRYMASPSGRSAYTQVCLLRRTQRFKRELFFHVRRRGIVFRAQRRRKVWAIAPNWRYKSHITPNPLDSYLMRRIEYVKSATGLRVIRSIGALDSNVVGAEVDNLRLVPIVISLRVGVLRPPDINIYVATPGGATLAFPPVKRLYLLHLL